MRVLLLAFLGLSLLGPAQAQTRLDPARPETKLLSAIPASVLFVRTTGIWRKNDKSGLSRMILARTDGPGTHPRLYVQWLQMEERTGQMQVIETVEIQEVMDWRLRINDYRIDALESGAAVTLMASPLATKVERNYLMEITGPGEVRVTAPQR